MSQPKYLNEEVKIWIQGLLDEKHILGASVAVVDNGMIESAGYGLAQLPDVPCTGDTIFRMASTSKAMGAAIIGMILRDNNKNTITFNGKAEKLTWSTPISHILGDDFELTDEHFTREITIEDALSNRSGICRHDYNYGPWLGETRNFTQSLRYVNAISAPIRTKFQYNNTMFAVIGAVIEKIEDKSFEEVARQRLWKPLGMESTFAKIGSLAASDSHVRDRLARGYHWIDNDEGGQTKQDEQSLKGQYIAEAHSDLDMTGPAAAVLSSVNDYAQWIKAMLEAASPTQERRENDPEPLPSNPVSHRLFNELTTARTIVIEVPSTCNALLKFPNITPQLYSLGWFTDSSMYAGQTILHHPGDCQGFCSHVYLLPEHNFGLVVTENGGFSGAEIAETIGRELIGRKLGIAETERSRGTANAATAVEERQEVATEKSNPLSTCTHENSTKPSSVVDSVDPAALIGTYHHQGYGKIEVAISSTVSLNALKPRLNNARIIKRSEASDGALKWLTSDNDMVSNDNMSYHVAFQGKRCFPTEFLLHPSFSRIQDLNRVESDDPDHRHTSFFTLETLWPHGDLQNDPVPGLPQGHGDPSDSKHPFKQESIYESTSLRSCSAVVEMANSHQISKGERDSSKDQVSDRDSPPAAARLGMLFGRAETDEADARRGEARKSPIEGWRKKMVWFEKVT